MLTLFSSAMAFVLGVALSPVLFLLALRFPRRGGTR